HSSAAPLARPGAARTPRDGQPPATASDSASDFCLLPTPSPWLAVQQENAVTRRDRARSTWSPGGLEPRRPGAPEIWSPRDLEPQRPGRPERFLGGPGGFWRPPETVEPAAQDDLEARPGRET
ncbi:hypothetical protein CRUP_019697, partial [Coryphaenoides rupestris]